VPEYAVLCRIFRNSFGRRSINQREMHRTAIREAKMVVAVGLVESVRVLYMPNDRLLYVGRCSFLRSSVNLWSRRRIFSSGSFLICVSPGSRYLYARSSHSNALQDSPRNAYP
jgi:hypothetical protein